MSASEEMEAEFFEALGAGDLEAVSAWERMKVDFDPLQGHFLYGSCWCRPVVEGDVVKHNTK